MARLTLILTLLLLTSTAHAQLTRDAVGSGRSALEAQLTSGARTRFGVRTDLGPGLPPIVERTQHIPFVTLQFRLTQHITRLTPDLALEFDLDAALAAESFYSSTGEFDGLWLGSPWLGLSVASRSPARTLRASFGVAPPLATLREIRVQSVTAGGVGGWNAWLTERELVPIGLLGLGEWRFTHLDVGAELALIVAPFASSYLRTWGVVAWAAAGVWLTGHLSNEVDLGARLQGVARFGQYDMYTSTSITESAHMDVSLTPFLRYWLTRAPSPSPVPAFVELRLNFNFVEPYGPVFVANESTWSLAVAIGTNW